MLTYWEPSGLWNAHRRPRGWDVQAGCPRLYEPFSWPARMMRESVQPMQYALVAPHAHAIDWLCVGVMLLDLSLGLFAQRSEYFIKQESVTPECR